MTTSEEIPKQKGQNEIGSICNSIILLREVPELDSPVRSVFALHGDLPVNKSLNQHYYDVEITLNGFVLAKDIQEFCTFLYSELVMKRSVWIESTSLATMIGVWNEVGESARNAFDYYDSIRLVLLYEVGQAKSPQDD